MKTTAEKPVNFNGFHGRFIRPLGKRAVVFHFQLFPGIYTADQQAFADTEALGGPLPATHMPTDYLQQVGHAQKIRAPFHRLRVLPDEGQRVGTRTYGPEEVRVLANMCRRNVSAGEEVRTISYGKAAGLVPRTGLGRYMDEYARGVEDGVSLLSFWSVAEEKEGEAPELIVVRLMSYDAAGKLAVRHCMPPLDEELADYVGFWQDIYRGAPLLAPTPPDA